MKRIIGLMALVAIAAAVYFEFFPYVVLHRFGSALEAGDSAALQELVDFPLLRQEFKAQLSASMVKEAAGDLNGNPFNALAQGLASTLAEAMVDAFVTPTVLLNVARGYAPNTESIAPSSRAKTPFENARVTRESLDRFSAWVTTEKGEEARFVFRRYGFGWKLVGMNIPTKD
jgi:hypothetical protein